MTTMETLIEEYRRGLFRPYHLTVAPDDGHSPDRLVFGYDTEAETHEALGRIAAEAERLVRDGHALRTDPDVRLHYWITTKDGAELCSGHGWELLDANHERSHA